MVLTARSKLMHGSYGEEITEAFAVEEGILLASEMELQQIIIKSDSLMVVEAINTSSFHGDMGPIIQGILGILSQLSSWKVKHLKRDYNRVAHELAQNAKAAGTSQQWRGMEPPMLQQFLLVDRAKC